MYTKPNVSSDCTRFDFNFLFFVDSQIVFMQYGNITNGIKNSHVFQIPTYCVHNDIAPSNLQAILSIIVEKNFISESDPVY